jgi:hypothetical protein
MKNSNELNTYLKNPEKALSEREILKLILEIMARESDRVRKDK